MSRQDFICHFKDKSVLGKFGSSCDPVTQDHFCYGCRKYICENHSIGINYGGSHVPSDPLVDDSEEVI